VWKFHPVIHNQSSKNNMSYRYSCQLRSGRKRIRGVSKQQQDEQQQQQEEEQA
jgi:hypothetical protein